MDVFERRAFLSTLALFLAGCAATPRHRHREGDNTGQESSLSVGDEREMTAKYLPKMRKEYPPHASKEAQRYISQLGTRLAQASGFQGHPYKYNFTVVDSKHVNAFALPAGTIFVTAPLIGTANSEAELAGVLGHEIGHVKARHTAERLHKARKDRSKGLIYGAVGGLLGGVAGYGLGKLLCRKNDKKCLQKAAIRGLGAGATGGLLVQKFGFMANSREDEMEADRIGFKVAHSAGYHKDHIGLFYEHLLEMEKKRRQNAGKQNALLKSLADAMSTHPPSKERVAQMLQMAKETRPRGKIINTKDFGRIQRLL